MNPLSTAWRARRAGQTLIFLVMMMVILTLVVLWNFDLHKILFVKLKSQNAGDAAAMAAARWQGIALNLVGELNVQQAVAIQQDLARGEDDFEEARAIAELQARLLFVGPMTAFLASQQAAKNNGMYVNEDYTERVREHAIEVQQLYNTTFREFPYENDPSPPTCWDNYADMIYTMAEHGIAAYPDNALFYTDFSSSAHYLLNPSFYDAVGSADWCWFFHQAMGLLQSYQSWVDWPPLPIVTQPRPMNAEYFSLRAHTSPILERNVARDDMEALRALLSEAAGIVISQEVARVEATWYVFQPDAWNSWREFVPSNFPFAGTIRDEYDYVGADASVRLEMVSPRRTPGAPSDTITWSAAAKPFGYLEGEDGRVKPNAYGIMLPSFHDVRLIPVDTSTGTAGGTRPGWAVHIYDHLGPYSSQGPSALTPGCWYCQQLMRWEGYAFRQSGLDWLRLHSDRCRVTTGGGGGPGGGSRRGH